MSDIHKWTTSFGTVILRRAPGHIYFVSKCGSHYRKLSTPHIVISMGRHKQLSYLSCGTDQHMHKMVAKAWVYNPCPSKFKWVDHIDGDRQNNDATNLRWVSPSLNGLNKRRHEYAKKHTRKYKSGKVGVFYQGRCSLMGRFKSVTDGSKERCEKACKKLINDTWITQYDKDVSDEMPPPRPYHMYYWTDYTTTPVMRPAFIDPPLQWTPERRSAQFII